jgi:hypothetical protein
VVTMFNLRSAMGRIKEPRCSGLVPALYRNKEENRRRRTPAAV